MVITRVRMSACVTILVAETRACGFRCSPIEGPLCVSRFSVSVCVPYLSVRNTCVSTVSLPCLSVHCIFALFKCPLYVSLFSTVSIP